MRNAKYFFTLSGVLFLVSISANAYTLGRDGVILNDNGAPVFMSQFDALEACPAGTHLPSIREFGQESRQRGALGTLEFIEVNPNRPPVGYHLFRFLKSPNKPATVDNIDQFYFNSHGYRMYPSGDIRNGAFWTSSIYFNSSAFAGYFDTDYGGFWYYERSSPNLSVRCFANSKY